MNKADNMIISALEEELQRSMQLCTRTKRPGKKKEDKYNPFFISYMLKEIKTIEISASNGAIQSIHLPNNSVNKNIRGDIRVGDYSDGCSIASFISTGPSDNNMIALKRELWQMTNEGLWESVKDYRDRATDSMGYNHKSNTFLFFSKEKQVIDILDNNLTKKQFGDIDIEYLSYLLKNTSAQLLKNNVFFSGIDFDVSYCKRYFVNSEGTKIIDDFMRYSIDMIATMPDKDNRIIKNHKTFHGRDLLKMPAEDELLISADVIISELYDIVNARQQKAGTYPTLVDGENHGVIWHEAIGHSLEGHRMDENEDDFFASPLALTFKGKIGSSVAPRFLSAYDDPTDKNLDGYYKYDEEGVKSKKVTLVKNGILKNYLHSRESAGKFKMKSNGHARASNCMDPTPRMSNIKVCSNNSYTLEELEEMLIKECEKQGKEYGLIFEGTLGGYTDTGESYFHTIPKKVFRLYRDGRQEQVRGIYQVGTPYQMLDNIIATSDNSRVFNGVCGAESGYIPSTQTAPDALIKSLEIGRLPKSSYGQIHDLLSKPPRK